MRKIHWTLATAVAGVLLTACGGAAGDSGTDAAPSLTITSPENGDIVDEPFVLRYKTSVDIGPPESGEHHVHIFADGRQDDYSVVTQTTFTVKDLPAGTHRIGVTLENADHSPAGATAEITVHIQNGATATPDTDEGGDYGGGY